MLRVLSRGAVFGPGAPRHRVDVHAPPDADVFHRLDPVGGGDDAGRIEVQADDRWRQLGGFVGDLNRAPWRHERGLAAHLHAVGIGREIGAQRPALHARSAEIHLRVVHEIRLVDDHERLAVTQLHGERRLDAVEGAHRSLRPELLGAVEPRPVGRDPPGARVVRHRELGQLVHDLEVAEVGLRRELVAERHAVVEGAHRQRELAVRTRGLLDGDFELVMVIADARDLAPGLCPNRVEGAAARIHDAQAVAQRGLVLELESEQGRCEQRAPVALHGVVQLPFMRLDQHGVASVGGRDAQLRLHPHGKQRQRNE